MRLNVRYGMTNRRRQRLYSIVDCLKEGLTVKEIADELGVSERTVSKDIKYIKENQ